MIGDIANRLTGVPSKVALQTRAVVVGTKVALRRRAALFAAIVVALALAPSATARAATITVDSLADTGAPGICVLRDAITAANTKTATNGCVAGTGHDAIQFSVTGTISLASTLPQVTDSLLTINGPASPGITIDGGRKVFGRSVQVMVVASGAALNLNHLTIAHGFSSRIFLPGGIENSGTLTIRKSTFIGNRGTGGGIYNTGTLTVIDSTFVRNISMCHECSVPGGGIYSTGTLTVIRSTFSDNSAGSEGGGIENGGEGTVISSTFSGNSASDGGGINNYGTLTVRRSTFSGNSATYRLGEGGGIDNNGGTLSTLTINNSTFFDNSAPLDGGAISNGIGTLIISSSTFSGNSASTGGEINNDDEFGAVTHLKSTILTASGSGSNCEGTITDIGYNISDDNSCGFSATGSLNNTDPMLDPAGLSKNGGRTKTIALLSGSPAIDAIPVTDCTDQLGNPISTDQRLFPRPDAGEQVCDTGAYEFQDPPTLAGQP